METGKPGLASAPVHIGAVTAQTEKRMDIQAPLTAVYIHTVPALPAQPYSQPPAAARKPAALHLAMPPLYSKETLPFLTFHIAGGVQSQPGLNLAAAAAPAARPKSAGKHVCPHCGRDCMKPSVLEKHLRCHTGERPYPCITCGVSFKTQSNLYKHKRTQAHARLSSESEQSSLGSQDNMSCSRETCTSSLSLDEHSEESGSLDKDATLPATEITCPANAPKVYSIKMQVPVSENNELTSTGHKTEPNEGTEVKKEGEKQRMESKKPPLNVGRHLPLQRQEATLFSKQWESSVSRGKSQNHESTDSGFSESSDHYPSPGSIIPDNSMDSLAESTKEHLEECNSTCALSESGQGGQEPKDTMREQEQKTLEERISKLISENTAVVEDKQLENVRPRKTVLSKQGSIDLPMPYTYKDSFHFDMRISRKTPNVGLQRNRNPGLYSSVPTQHSSTIDHAPLTRSSSLPFSVTLQQPERSSPTSSCQNDYVTLIRRGSSGQINPIKSVNQQSSTHRPLVRQAAVDCNHATDSLFTNSSVEEACAGGLSCDGDGSDICGEPSNRKFRRKKAQKFAYNKWYMYGGGTFKKLYGAEKVGDNNSVIKGRKTYTNPEHELVQGLQKRLSAVYKETVTTTSSTINFTSSSATVFHPGCPPAHPSGGDFNLKTVPLHTSSTSLKTSLGGNLPLSALSLHSIGSLGTQKTESMGQADVGRLTDEEKQSDFTSPICGAHVPSDRKKQRTDDKVVSPVELDTDPNTLTHSPPSATGGLPQQDTNLSFVNLQANQKHPQLKGALFPSCIIRANSPSVTTSPATPMPSAAKTSFLPKYQLKLPNASEPNSNLMLPVADKPKGTDGYMFTAAPSCSHFDQTSSSVSEKRCIDAVTSPLMQTSDIKQTSGFASVQGRLMLPEALRLNQNVTSNLAVVHRPLTGTTLTTTCMQSYQAGLCSISIQSLHSKPCVGSALAHLPTPVAPVVENTPVTPIIITENTQRSATAITVFTQGQPPRQSHPYGSPVSGQLNPANRANATLSPPVAPYQIVPFDSVQPSGQNVFHVQTADLQICLQLISDEQLALIEPQIERQTVGSPSQRCDTEAVATEITRTKAQNSALVENTDEQGVHVQPGHQKELDQSKSLPILNTESKNPPPSVEFWKVQPNLHITEHSESSLQATVSAESKPPEAPGSLLHPHKQSHVNIVRETQSCMGDVMLTAASLEGVKSGRSQTSEEDHAFSLNHHAEEQHLVDRQVSQGGLVSHTISSQHKLTVTSLSSCTVNQNSTKSQLLGIESQHKLKSLGGSCNVGTMKAKGGDSTCESSRIESGGTCLPPQVGLGLASSAPCAGTVSTFSPRQSNQQASIPCRNPAESSSSETLETSKHANLGCDGVVPSDNSAPSQEMSLGESQGVISSAHSQTQMGLFTSVSSNIHMEKAKNNSAVLQCVQRPTTGLMEGASVAGHVAQKEPQTRGHGGTHGQLDWRPKQSQEPEETNQQWMEEQWKEVVVGKNKNGGMSSIKTDEVPGQTGRAESNCRYVVSPDPVMREGEDRRVKTDSSWLSERHPQCLSQTQPGMSEYPPQSPQSVSDNLNLPASSGRSSLFNSPQPPLEMNSLCLSQPQQHRGGGLARNKQPQLPCRSNPSQGLLAETQNAFSRTQTQTPCTQQGTTAAGTDSDSECSCNKSTLGSYKSQSLSPDVQTPSSSHSGRVPHTAQVSRVTAGVTGDAQAAKTMTHGNNTAPPSHAFMYTEHDTKERAPHEHTGQSGDSWRADITTKYQSFLMASQLHSYSPVECLAEGVRPLQSCQEYTEDTSSSDDEGKLIIEL